MLRRPDKRYLLSLFVAGDVPASRAAAASIASELKRTTNSDFELEIIDIIAEPERAEQEGVFATPMLIRNRPAPSMRVLGDMTDAKQLLGMLGIREEKGAPPP